MPIYASNPAYTTLQSFFDAWRTIGGDAFIDKDFALDGPTAQISCVMQKPGTLYIQGKLRWLSTAMNVGIAISVNSGVPLPDVIGQNGELICDKSTFGTALFLDNTANINDTDKDTRTYAAKNPGTITIIACPEISRYSHDRVG